MTKLLFILSTFVFLSSYSQAEDLGNRFDFSTKQCGKTLSDGTFKKGLNPSFVGECGDLKKSSLGEEVVFSNQNLIGIDFSGNGLGRADFSGSDLRYAKFDNTGMLGTIFDRANLENADLSHAWMEFVKFRKTNLRNTNFSASNQKASVVEGSDFSGANFSSAHFSSMNGLKHHIKDNKFAGANFSNSHIGLIVALNSDFSGANFQNATIRNTALRSSNLRGADFSDSNIFVLDLSFTDLRFATLVDLKGMDDDYFSDDPGPFELTLIGADLRNAKVSGKRGYSLRANRFDSAKYNDATLLPFKNPEDLNYSMEYVP